MASLHHRRWQDKTVLSWRQDCLVLSAVWTELETSQDCRRLKTSKQFWPVLNLVLFWHSFQFATWLPIVTSYLESSQMHSHHRWDWTKLFSLQYTEDYWKLSATVATSVHTAGKTRQNSLVLSVSAVWTSHNSHSRNTRIIVENEVADSLWLMV